MAVNPLFSAQGVRVELGRQPLLGSFTGKNLVRIEKLSLKPTRKQVPMITIDVQQVRGNSALQPDSRVSQIYTRNVDPDKWGYFLGDGYKILAAALGCDVDVFANNPKIAEYYMGEVCGEQQWLKGILIGAECYDEVGKNGQTYSKVKWAVVDQDEAGAAARARAIEALKAAKVAVDSWVPPPPAPAVVVVQPAVSNSPW